MSINDISYNTYLTKHSLIKIFDTEDIFFVNNFKNEVSFISEGFKCKTFEINKTTLLFIPLRGVIVKPFPRVPTAIKFVEHQNKCF